MHANVSCILPYVQYLIFVVLNIQILKVEISESYNTYENLDWVFVQWKNMAIQKMKRVSMEHS